MTVHAIIEHHSPAAAPLELYSTDALFPIWKPTQDCFSLGYKDEVVGSIGRQNHGPRNEWAWSFHDSAPKPSAPNGISKTFEEAAKDAAAAFRYWVETHGDPKPPRWKTYWHRTISELLAGDHGVWPPPA
jgi:hypothetical protein